MKQRWKITGAAGLLLATSVPSLAQTCPEGWVPAGGALGAGGHVYATTLWDPDGAGPRSPILVAGGNMNGGGTSRGSGIITFDFQTGEWSTLGVGFTSGLYPPQPAEVRAMAVLPDGSLVAGGTFVSSGETPVLGVARWDGTAWTPLGEGFDGFVNTLCVSPDGSLIAGGYLRGRPGQPTLTNVARWDGTRWNSIGAGLDGEVRALNVTRGGEIIAGGAFPQPGIYNLYAVARWNGTAWSRMGSDAGSRSLNSTSSAIAISPQDEIYVSGNEFDCSGREYNRVFRWDGIDWVPTGASFTGRVYALSFLPDGDLIAGGCFVEGVARMHAQRWSFLPAGASFVKSFTALPDGGFVTGTGFRSDRGGNSLLRWRNSAWSPLDPSPIALDGPVNCILPLGDGSAIIGGSFTHAGAVVVNRVARWDGSRFEALGEGVAREVYALTKLPNGDIVTGGLSGISLWNGDSWQPIFGLDGIINALATLPNGHAVAGGHFWPNGAYFEGAAEWDGQQWSPLGGPLNRTDAYSYVYALLVTPDGALVAGGTFELAGGTPVHKIARWSGQAWLPMGDGFVSTSSVRSLSNGPNGSIIAAGRFSALGDPPAWNVARWDGQQWRAMGAGVSVPMTAVQALPNGDVYAGGTWYIGSYPGMSHLWKWNGTIWSPIAPEVVAGNSLDGGVRALALRSTGELLVGGDFSSAGGYPDAFLAQYARGRTPPSVVVPPAPVTSCLGADVTLSVSAAGAGPLAYAWRHDGVPLDPTQNPSSQTSTLHLQVVRPLDQGAYDCVISNACGSVTSSPATVTICPADTDDGSRTGHCDASVTIDDLLYYITIYANGLPRADLDDGSNTGTPDGGVTIDDLLYYLARFEAGC